MVYDVGRVCVKLAGRDAGKKCVIVDTLDNGYVLIDGETRRRKCNTAHLEPTQQSVSISPQASHDDVCKALDIEVHKGKPKKAAARPKHVRKTVAKPAPVKKAVPAKKEAQ